MGVIGTNIYIIGAGSGGVTTEDLPAVLKDFYAQNGGTGKIVLKWAFNNNENLTGVYICYQAGEYPASPNDGVKVIVDNYTTLSVDVENLENGVEYFFRAYPYREIDGVKYFQTCNETCKTASTPNAIVTPADLEIDGNYFVEIPKCTWADLGIGESEETFPAFIIDGKEVDSIYIGKYCGDVENNKAISKKGRVPKIINNINIASDYCKNNGTGWHLMTRLEYMTIICLSMKNNHIPKTIPTFSSNTPTGYYSDVSCSHDGTESGIYEMAISATGMFHAGIRFCGRELQVISRNGMFANDAANASIDQTASSNHWYAIDGTTGDLIMPDGKGLTKNSIKANGSKWDIVSTSNMSAKFSTITCVDSICDKAINILIALGLFPSPILSTASVVLSGTGAPPTIFTVRNSEYFSLYAGSGANGYGHYRPVFYSP